MNNQEEEKRKQKSSGLMINPYGSYDLIVEKHLLIPFLYNQEQQQQNEIVFRILTGKQKEIVFIELQSEEDLFFYFQYWLNHHDLKNLNSLYNLELEQLAEFVIMIQRILMDVQEHSKQMYFQMKNQNQLTLNITNQINHNIYLVLEMKFKKSTTQRTNQLAAFRYGKLRQEVSDIQTQIQQAKDVIKARNPYLLTFISKI